MSTDDRMEKLERFFKEVADLTADHEVIAGEAVVYPSALGEALSRVDPDWYHYSVNPALKVALKAKRLAVLAELTAYDRDLGLCDVSPRRKTLDDLSMAEFEDGTYDRVPEQ
jgi:hypothetical protein